MDVVVLALRVLLSLGVVLALLFVLHRKVSKLNGNRAGAGLVSVVARQGIGAKASVVVLDAEGTRFYLGVTEQSVSVLHSSAAPRALQAVPVTGDSDPAAHPNPATATLGAGSTADPADARFAASLRLAAASAPLGTPAAPVPVPSVPVPSGAPTTRRAARAAQTAEVPQAARPAPPASGVPPLQGSILSPTTWKQTAAFLRQGRAG
ncbi:FliO/MopB family protein [Arthrobacter agilis]|uniref:FliO/MopB family protein n=1 Tax=Arthrobacter agilis TaxID=37921 RepID=UPI000B34BDF0|nr:flagellar biosynthetic protein FliO [Arthrobacter agilis]OUM43748.1 hypothetical protein B8W74_06275 [Arthrobacter agilis]PPB46666.1 hypothetical protein CI784_05115 [Arthrobacter agilis]TPV24990.1 FliO/MopB family protein [Arthrobacter agilis]VDR31167.1 flagellar biosynthetic protein FliO [Arthrobacter agilis]